MAAPFAGDIEHIERFRRFVSRYAGYGSQGVTDLEAAEWYQQVAGLIDADTYEEAATETLARFPDHERQAFAEALSRLGRERQFPIRDSESGTDPRVLAHTVRALQESGPSLAELITGPSGPAASPGREPHSSLVRGVVAGIAAAGGARLLSHPPQQPAPRHIP